MRRIVLWIMIIVGASAALASCVQAEEESLRTVPIEVATTVVEAALDVRSVEGLGAVLTDSEGRVLYLFEPDRAARVTCTDACLASWPAVPAATSADVAEGVDPALIDEINGPGGTITVNAMCPTAVDTPLFRDDAQYRDMVPHLYAEGAEHSFAQREEAVKALIVNGLHALPIPWIEPADVAHAIEFLVSDRARYITGEVLDVAAGSNARHLG